MSRFDELHQAYIDARKTFFAQRDASIALAGSVREGLERYLGCPSFTLRFLSHAGGTSLVKTNTAAEAAWLDAGGTWRFSLGMDLSEAMPGVHREAAKQTVVLDVSMQPTADGFTVALKGWNDRFNLPTNADSAEHAVFYEFVFQRMIESYRQTGQRFFESLLDSKRAIGG
jgi:hypothetical protein